MATPKEQHDARAGARMIGRDGSRTPPADALRETDVGPPAERDAVRARPEPVTTDEPSTE